MTLVIELSFSIDELPVKTACMTNYCIRCQNYQSDTCTTLLTVCEVVKHTSFYDITTPQCVMHTDIDTPSYLTVQRDLLTAGQPGQYIELVHLSYQSFYMPSATYST